MLNRLSRFNGRLPPARLFVRSFTQTSPPHAHPFPFRKYLIIGVAGGTVCGGILAGAGYAWYRYSGVHHLVERFKPAMLSLKKTKGELGKEAPSHVLKHLRDACKAYVAYLPLAGILVDMAFDGIDDAVDTHAQAANAIIAEACQNVLAVVSGNRDAPNLKNAFEIMSIAKQLGNDLGALGVKVGQPLAQNLDLENKSAQLVAASTAAFDVVKTKSVELSHTLAGATEQDKNFVQSSNAPEKMVQKAKSIIFPKSEK